jgi:hypothetical protein
MATTITRGLAGKRKTRLTVIDQTTAISVPAEHCDGNHIYTNAGAAATRIFTLPVAQVGMSIKFCVMAVQVLTIAPASGETLVTVATGAAGAADHTLSADAVGENIELFCVSATAWQVKSYIGTWTLS